MIRITILPLFEFQPQGEDATAYIAALFARLAMRKKLTKGAAISLFFHYTSQANRTILHAVQLWILG